MYTRSFAWASESLREIRTEKSLAVMVVSRLMLIADKCVRRES